MQLKLSSAKMAVILTRGRWVLKKRPYPDSKVNGANMGPTWVLSAPRGSHVGLMNLAICVCVPYLWGWCGLVLGRRCLNWPMWPASRRCHRRRLVVAVHISRLQSHTRLVSCLSRDHEGVDVICFISKYLVGYRWTDRDMCYWFHLGEHKMRRYRELFLHTIWYFSVCPIYRWLSAKFSLNKILIIPQIAILTFISYKFLTEITYSI